MVLLDETALLSCMAYVGLNPIRTGIATNLGGNDFASIKERIQQFKSYQRQQSKPNTDCRVSSQPNSLLPLVHKNDHNDALAIIGASQRPYVRFVIPVLLKSDCDKGSKPVVDGEARDNAYLSSNQDQ